MCKRNRGLKVRSGILPIIILPYSVCLSVTHTLLLDIRGQQGVLYMDKQRISKILKEKQKRGDLNKYKNDFSKFAEEQIKIITKDATQGFVPFKLNECQHIITEKLNKQLKFPKFLFSLQKY